jgi:hypothetical protein
MSAFRILNQFPVFFGLTGQLAAGGSLRFYNSGTTTPKSVFGNKALSIDNGPVIAIGTDGRPVVDTWGSGSYRVRLYAKDGTLVDEADNVEVAGGGAASIPTLVDGYFLTNNGSLLLWAPIRQLPDPTGQNGKMVIADGAGYSLQPVPVAPTPPEPEIVVAANSFRAGTSASTTKFFLQTGTGSAPPSSTPDAKGLLHLTAAEITFPTAFASVTSIVVTPTGGAVNIVGFFAIPCVTAQSPTGFTVQFQMNDDDAESRLNITSPVNFMWLAVGTRVVT